MDFKLTDEQTLLADTVQRLFEQEHDLHTRRRRLNGEAVRADAMWPRLVDLGLAGVMLPESRGGMGLADQEGAVAAHLVAQAMGRFLVPDPFVSHAVVSAPLLAEVGAPEQVARWLLQPAAGRLALAHEETGAAPQQVHAILAQGQWRLSGRTHGVMDAAGAAAFLVSARGTEGTELFLVPRDAAGLGVQARVAFDGGDVGDLHLDGVTATAEHRLTGGDAARCAVERAVGRGIAALLAEAVGVMAQLLAWSIAHLKTRHQFGQPLAAFQALQHHVADMASRIEQARSMALLAGAACLATDASERRRGLSSAKAMVGRQAIEVGRLAVQLHGGMGMTDEVPVGHAVRRLMVIDAQWGSAESHLDRLAADLAAPATR